MTPLTPAPTAAGALADWRYEIQHGPDGEAIYAWVYDDNNNMVCTAKTHHAIMIVAALRNSAPQETRGDEPVAWRYRFEPDLKWHATDAENYVPKKSVHPQLEVQPLYAAPQQSPRLEREGIKGKLIEMGFTSRDGTVINGGTLGVIDAILALLSPDTTVASSPEREPGPMVPWELDCQRAVCAAPECECPAVSSTDPRAPYDVRFHENQIDQYETPVTSNHPREVGK